MAYSVAHRIGLADGATGKPPLVYPRTGDKFNNDDEIQIIAYCNNPSGIGFNEIPLKVEVTSFGMATIIFDESYPLTFNPGRTKSWVCFSDPCTDGWPVNVLLGSDRPVQTRVYFGAPVNKWSTAKTFTIGSPPPTFPQIAVDDVYYMQGKYDPDVCHFTVRFSATNLEPGQEYRARVYKTDGKYNVSAIWGDETGYAAGRVFLSMPVEVVPKITLYKRDDPIPLSSAEFTIPPFTTCLPYEDPFKVPECTVTCDSNDCGSGYSTGRELLLAYSSDGVTISWGDFTRVLDDVNAGAIQNVEFMFVDEFNKSRKTIDEFCPEEPVLPEDITKPSVSIVRPTFDEIFDVSMIMVEGSATDNGGLASVTVNGISVTLSEIGTTVQFFSEQVALIEGTNTIEVVATDLAGNTRTETVMVTYRPTLPPTPCSVSTDKSEYKINETVTIRYENAPAASILEIRPYPSGIYGASFNVEGSGGKGYFLRTDDPVGTWEVKLQGGDCLATGYITVKQKELPAPVCSDYGTKAECESGGCYWYNGECHSTEPTYHELGNEPDCELYGFYWYDGACHLRPEEEEVPVVPPCPIACICMDTPLVDALGPLRAFRDKVLKKFGFGRWFVSFYYNRLTPWLSPKILKMRGKNVP